MPSRTSPLAVAPDEVAVRVAQLGEQFNHLEKSLDEHKRQSAQSHIELKADLTEIKGLVQAAVERGYVTERKVEKYEFLGKWGMWLIGGLGAVIAWGLDLIPSVGDAVDYFTNHQR